MAEDSVINGQNAYEEDIAVVAPGTVIVDHPCVVWDMTVCIEEAVVAVVNFSNNSDGYDSADRVGKVVLNGPTTIHCVFPKGRYCTEGLSAIANNGSADVRVSYD